MFQTPSIIEKVQTLVDKSVKLSVVTQEMNSEEMSKLFSLAHKIGWFIFSENVLQEVDIPKENAPEFKGEKTPQQRLRAVIFKVWSDTTNKQIDFDTFYKRQIEGLINQYKDKLN